MERADKNFKLGHSDLTLLGKKEKQKISSVVVTRHPLNIYDLVAISYQERTLTT